VKRVLIAAALLIVSGCLPAIAKTSQRHGMLALHGHERGRPDGNGRPSVRSNMPSAHNKTPSSHGDGEESRRGL